MAPARGTSVAWFFSEFLTKAAGIEHGPTKLLLMWTVGFVPVLLCGLLLFHGRPRHTSW